MPPLYPKTLLEFEHWFRTEEACRDYLARIRWHKGFRCPRCGHGQAWKTRRGLFHCGSCRADISVTTGTIFQGSHLSLRLWFRAIWWITSQKSGVSALGLQRILGLGSYKTAWSCLHKLRGAMIRPGREPLSVKVEVDEIVVGGRLRGDRGSALGEFKSLVVAAVEVRGKGSGRVRFGQIPDKSAKSLESFVQRVVAPGTQVVTDGRPGYSQLGNLGFNHLPTALDGRGRQAAKAVLPRVHLVASLLKRWLLGIHHGRVSKKHLAAYLDEFAFRFNRRHSPHRGMLFYRTIQQAIIHD